MVPPITQLVKGEEHLLLPKLGAWQKPLALGTKQVFFMTSEEGDGSELGRGKESVSDR